MPHLASEFDLEKEGRGGLSHVTVLWPYYEKQ